ncbi:MAG: hypothetical protein KDD48_06710, partial [Bdellovibrionales bacterium]|nr:hypothetical protein [Bdellovibrionales bacterium]
MCQIRTLLICCALVLGACSKDPTSGDQNSKQKDDSSGLSKVPDSNKKPTGDNEETKFPEPRVVQKPKIEGQEDKKKKENIKSDGSGGTNSNSENPSTAIDTDSKNSKMDDATIEIEGKPESSSGASLNESTGPTIEDSENGDQPRDDEKLIPKHDPPAMLAKLTFKAPAGNPYGFRIEIYEVCEGDAEISRSVYAEAKFAANQDKAASVIEIPIYDTGEFRIFVIEEKTQLTYFHSKLKVDSSALRNSEALTKKIVIPDYCSRLNQLDKNFTRLRKAIPETDEDSSTPYLAEVIDWVSYNTYFNSRSCVGETRGIFRIKYVEGNNGNHKYEVSINDLDDRVGEKVFQLIAYRRYQDGGSDFVSKQNLATHNRVQSIPISADTKNIKLYFSGGTTNALYQSIE